MYHHKSTSRQHERRQGPRSETRTGESRPTPAEVIAAIAERSRYGKYAALSAKDASEKCDAAAREIGEDVEFLQPDYLSFNFYQQWDAEAADRGKLKADRMPTNHYVVQVPADASRIIVDATQQQFEGGTATISDRGTWETAFRGLFERKQWAATVAEGNISDVTRHASLFASRSYNEVIRKGLGRPWLEPPWKPSRVLGAPTRLS